MGMGRGSTNQQELYRDVIERLVVLCPSQDILLKAERVLNAIHCKIKAVYLQNNLLVESRDRLLPKLMSGEIEVYRWKYQKNLWIWSVLISRE